MIDSDGQRPYGLQSWPSRPSSASDERRHLWVFAVAACGRGYGPIRLAERANRNVPLRGDGSGTGIEPEAHCTYQLLGEPFQIEPATIDVTVVTGGLRLAHTLGAPLGFRKRGKGGPRPDPFLYRQGSA